MKIFLAIFIVAIGIPLVSAQSIRSGGKKSAEQLRREYLQKKAAAYVSKPEDYRIVDGKLYNAVLSTNWFEIDFEFRKRHEKGAICYIYDRALTRSQYDGRLREIDDKSKPNTVLVVNFPTNQVVTGQTIWLYVMRTGTYEYDDEVIKMFDHGVQSPTNWTAAPKSK